MAAKTGDMKSRTHLFLILALIALNILVKWTLWAQPPQTFPDSLGYIAPAMRLLDGLGYGSQDNGYRTPTYPLFIAAIVSPFPHAELSECREARVPACLGEAQHTPGGKTDLRAVTIVQIVLGILTTLLVYGFAFQVSRSAWIAALCALTYPIDLSTGYWEISLLTDTLTTCLLSLAVFLTVMVGEHNGEQEHDTAGKRAPLEDAGFSRTLGGERSLLRWGLRIALGLTLGALALCHSVFVLYAVVPAAFLWWRGRPSPPPVVTLSEDKGLIPKTEILRFARNDILVVLAIPALLVLAWSARNYRVDGYFTPSTIAGYNLTQMVGPFMEQAPAPYRDLAEIYIDYRSDRIAERGTHSGTIFLAYRDMINIRQTTWAGLSRMLTEMSLQMIAHNPRGYLQVAAQSFFQFWKFGLGRQNSELPLSWDWVKWFLDTRVHQAWTVLFFLAPFGLLLVQFSRRVEVPGATWIWFAIATVLYAALLSSAFNFGDNERYRTHVARLQYSAVILVAWYVTHLFLAWRQRTSGAVAAVHENA